MSIPPAHKRLVPRKPRKDKEPDPKLADEHEVTSERVVIRPDTASPEPPAPAPAPKPRRPATVAKPAPAKPTPAKPAAPRRVRPQPPTLDDDDLGGATVRQPERGFELDEIELTNERMPVAPPPDPDADGDAAETFAIMRPVRGLPLDPSVPRRAFPEHESTATNTGSPIPPPLRDLHELHEIDGNAFNGTEPTVMGELDHHLPVVRMQDLVEIDANAFAELEPTSLKPATGSITGLEDRPLTHISPAEIGFLAAMAEGHEPSRLKYIDWLERRGERARAEFLRLDHELFTMNPKDIRYDDTYQRLRECAERISVDWRSRVARSLIEGCMTPGGQCPTYWRSLPATADDVRQCTACGEHVFYCVTMELARMRLAQGQLVAIDVTCQRWPGDLQASAMIVPHCGSCGAQVPQGTRFCPHCGQPQ
ncbi:MAG TPA: zinc-ribbon domain-containing protein [Kofleriaceae bacterium]|nr:zinc-ribbon domain-containing protein [Kofleriaceae bacterium]